MKTTKRNPEYNQPLSNALALKLVLNFFLYRRNRGYAILHYVVYTRNDIHEMVGQSVPHAVIAGARKPLAKEGYSLLQIDANRFILIRLAQLSNWTKLSARYVRSLPNDERQLRHMLDLARAESFIAPLEEKTEEN